MANYKSIIITKGIGGYGGPIIITPTEEKHKFIYIVGGGERPAIVEKIEELTGMEAVNGFKTAIPENETALAIIDCGGTLRCGIYPQKNIPTLNVLATGKSGPLAKFITEDIYVSNVGVDQIKLWDESENIGSEAPISKKPMEKEYTYTTDKKLTQQNAERGSFIAKQPLLDDEILVGDILVLDNRNYKITAVGSEVNKNLVNLAHITISFNGKTQAVLGGTLYVETSDVADMKIGSVIEIRKN